MLSEIDYDNIVEWIKSMSFKGNRLKENFYAVKSMMKPLGLGYQKIDMCLNFCMIYYGEYANFTKCKTCQHSRYKPNRGRERAFFTYKKLRVSQSLLGCKVSYVFKGY